MKFRLLSDLHNEFGLFVVPALEDDKNTVLILAGDINVGIDARRFIKDLCSRFHTVVYVLGNHEFYHHSYHTVRREWRNIAGTESSDNFVFLDNNTKVIGSRSMVGDVRIIGGTLWTDMNGNDWFAKQHVGRSMNDFGCIKIDRFGERNRFHPDDAYAAHRETRTYIEAELAKPFTGKTVVVTHHLPHPLCVHPRFKGDPGNAGYMSNLDALIEGNHIDVWCHGHTHDNVDIEVHGTRILCNPRGYQGVALNPGFNPVLAFDV